MKHLLLFSTLALLVSCNVYQSEPNEFINTSGKIQSGKIVINSSETIENAYCLVNSGLQPEKNMQLIDRGDLQQQEYSLYQSGQTLSVVTSDEDNEILCNYKSIETTDKEPLYNEVLDLSLEAFKTL